MSKLKRITTMLLVCLLALTIAPSVKADNNDEGSALIDTSKTGSITIHKFDSTGSSDSSDFDKVGNGTELDTSGFGNALGGVTFKVTLIPGATGNTTALQAQTIIGLMTTAELAQNQITGITGDGGIKKFDNLTQGIYLVEEVENNVTGTVPAFLVSIPMTNPITNSSWLYDIHVYPKNTLAPGTLQKHVLDDNGDPQSSITANIGEDVTWVISATVPGAMNSINANNPDKGYFFITDSLDSRLNYKSVKVELVSPDGQTREELEKDTHYKLTAPTVGAPGTANDDIIVDFKTVAGLAKLVNTPIDSTIEITITTVVNETAVTNLARPIKNSAKMYFNNEDGDPGDPTDPPIIPTDPTPEVDLLGIAIKKVDENGELLNGATFTIYETTANVENGSAIQLGDGADWTETSGSSLAVVGSSPITYLDGYLYFSGEGLDDLDLPSTTGTTYYFVETTAPSDYQLLGITYALDCGTTTTITNILKPDFTLPITGGAGTLPSIIVGIALISGAATLFVLYKKKEKA